MSAYSKQQLRDNLRLDETRIRFATSRPFFYAQGTFDSRCKVGKIKKKSHIYLYYSKRNEKFKIFKPGKNNDKYLIAEIDRKDIKKSIDYNYTHTIDGCIISYTDINTKKNCKVVLTPCDETKRKTKYRKCPIPGIHFDTPNPSLEHWKYLLNLWILESPSRGAVESKSKPTRKSSPSTRKTPSPSTRKTPSPSKRKSSSRSKRKSSSRTRSKRGGAKKYHKATKKHSRKNIKKTRKNK